LTLKILLIEKIIIAYKIFNIRTLRSEWDLQRMRQIRPNGFLDTFFAQAHLVSCGKGRSQLNTAGRAKNFQLGPNIYHLFESLTC